MFEPKYGGKYKHMSNSSYGTVYEADRKSKPYRPTDVKPGVKPSAGFDKSDVKQHSRAIMDSRKKANLCFRCGEKWTPEHEDVCKMKNVSSAKLSMIIEFSDDEEVTYVADPHDVSHDELTGAHDGDEALTQEPQRGLHFPLIRVGLLSKPLM